MHRQKDDFFIFNIKPVLTNALSCYNSYINNTFIKHHSYNLGILDTWYIPCFEEFKYYCFIYEYSKSTIFYFFKKNNTDSFCVNVEKINTLSHFKGALFEGYMDITHKDGSINNNVVYEFKITDILIQNSIPVKTPEYTERRCIISRLFDDVTLNTLNNMDDIISFKLQGGYKNILIENKSVDIERINGYTKEIVMKHERQQVLQQVNCISKTNLHDVYNVFNKKTLKDDGILYIKTLENSKYMKQLFNETVKIDMLCEFNYKLNKWVPVYPTT